MKKFVKGIINRRIIVLIISILLLLFGTYSYINIPKQEMPEINMPMGIVQVIVPGYSSRQVQTKVVEDIEQIINSYQEVKDYNSTAYDNVAIVQFELDMTLKNTDDVLYEIENEIMNADLDEGILDINVTTEFEAPGAIFAIHSNKLSEFDLEQIAKDLAGDLEGIKHVNNTLANSPYEKEIVVEIDYDELEKTPLTVSDINNIIAAEATEVPLGSVDVNSDEKGSIIINSKFTDIDELDAMVVYEDESGEYLLKDVADVNMENTQNKKIYSFNGQQVAFVEMYFEDGIDFVKLGDEIKVVVDDFEKNIDERATITTMSFSPDYVKEQVGQVMINLLQCMAIVMLVVLLGLGIRNALVIAISIPVVVMSTMGLLYYTGNSLQLMTIAGLIVSIGILVDNAIVISEAVQHNLDSGMDRKEASIQAVVENFLPVLTSTLTTVAAFIPLLALPGIAGDVAFSLPLTIIIAISISFVVAMTLAPVLASMMFKPHKNAKGKKHIREFKFLTKGIKFMFKLSVIPTIVAFALLAIVAVTTFTVLEIDMLPRPEKSVVYIDYEYGELNDNKATLHYAQAIEQVVLNQDDIISYGYSQGGNLPQFDMSVGTVENLPQNGRFFINFDCLPKETPDYMEKISQQLKPLEEYGSFSVERIELRGSGAPVQVVMESDDLYELNEKARYLYNQIEKQKSFNYGELNIAEHRLDLELEFDADELEYHGLTVIQIQQQIAKAVNPQNGEYYDDGSNELDVVVKTDIISKSDLLDLNILKSNGQKIPLQDLVYSSEVSNLEYINSTNGKYSATIDAHMATGYSTYDLQNTIADIIDTMDLKEVKVSFKGENEITEEVFGGLGVALIVALLAIYLIMYFQFNSLKQPLIIFISIPLSFIGSLLALLIMDEFITLTGMLGLVSLVGIVVNNGILLVEGINKLRREGYSVFDSCIQATNRRLRPILLTSLTTILGLLPLAIFGGYIFRPMAASFMGGLIVSTALVLFMVPSLYYLIYKKEDKPI